MSKGLSGTEKSMVSGIIFDANQYIGVTNNEKLD